MSPVARSQRHAGRALLVAGIAVVLLIAAAWGFSKLGEQGEVEIRLGDDTFEAGDAERIAAEIGERGPVIYSDVSGGSRDIWVQHRGDDPESGWLAFDVRPPGSPRDCVAEWQADDEVFVASCTGEEFPVDGDGLPQYPVTVEDGDLEVDLNA
ncbi:MAG: hypothetical protein ACRD2C_10045 [Acidimicrobiales bacterium]